MCVNPSSLTRSLGQESQIKWASRWDTYLTMSDVQIHWFSIVNSVVVVFFLSGALRPTHYSAGPSVCSHSVSGLLVLRDDNTAVVVLVSSIVKNIRKRQH